MKCKYVWLGAVCLFLFSIWLPEVSVYAAQSNSRALIVSRGDYGSASMNLTPGPQNDGQNFQRILQTAYGLDIPCRIREKEGVTTVAGVQAEIQDMFADSDEDDVNYFFYSGHGSQSGLSLGSGTLSAAALAEAFTGIQGKNIIVIDCCYSGRMATKSSLGAPVGEAVFLEQFIAEFDAAIKPASPQKRSTALTNSKFKLLLAASSEEESFQDTIGENNANLGYFTSVLSIGCGVNARKVNAGSEYLLGTAGADLNRDGSIAMNEIYQYIGNTCQVNHVRVYPEYDTSEFLPLANAAIPAVTFEKAAVTYDESNQPTLELTYRSAASFTLKMGYYKAENWGLYYLISDICNAEAEFGRYEESELVWQAEKTLSVAAANPGLQQVSLPLDTEELSAGDYTVILQADSGSVRYLLPFHLVQMPDSQLLEQLTLSEPGDSAVYLPETEAGELKIRADFGTSLVKGVEKPSLDCIILDGEDHEVRTLGRAEWMQVIGIPGTWSNELNDYTKFNCYKDFYWDGRTAAGEYAAPGVYTVQVTASSGTESIVKTKTVYLTPTAQISTKQLYLSNDGSENITIVYQASFPSEAVISVLDASGTCVMQWTKPVAAANTEYSFAWEGRTAEDAMLVAGTYDLSITAAAGAITGTAVLEKAFTVISPVSSVPLVISHLSLSSKSISDASKNQEITLSYQVNYTDAKMTVTVVDRNNRLVKTLLNAEAKGSALQSITWDGTGADGAKVPAGDYYFLIEASIDGRSEEIISEKMTVSRAPLPPPAIKPVSVLAKVGSKAVKNITIGKREKISFTPVVLPANAGNKTITYQSGNPRVATVSAKGQVVGKAAGKTKIILTTVNGKKATIGITVKAAPGKVSFSTDKKTMKKGKSYKAKLLFPRKTASYQLKYTSSNRKVATIDANGKIKALKKGKTIITVKTFNGKRAKMRIVVS